MGPARLGHREGAFDALGDVHPFAVKGHEIARASLHEVDAGSAKYPVKGPRLRVEDLVVAEAAEEEVAPCPAHDQVIAKVALDPVVAEAAVEALDPGADDEAGIVIAGAAPDQVVAEAAVDRVGGASPVEGVVAALAEYAVGRRGAHYRVGECIAHKGGRQSHPASQEYRYPHRRQDQNQALHP